MKNFFIDCLLLREDTPENLSAWGIVILALILIIIHTWLFVTILSW